MLVKAMEVCGTEGIFKFTCESVMQVMRSNETSLIAMLEAFVHDPLINWRLVASAHGNMDPDQQTDRAPDGQPGADGEAAMRNDNGDLEEPAGLAGELNERATKVMTRLGQKLHGTDGGGPDTDKESEFVDTVPMQVERLIDQATSHENLCQAYIGWCPFW